MSASAKERPLTESVVPEQTTIGTSPNYWDESWHILIQESQVAETPQVILDRSPERFLRALKHRDEIIASVRPLEQPTLNPSAVRAEIIDEYLVGVGMDSKQIELKDLPSDSQAVLSDVNLHSAFEHNPNCTDGATFCACLSAQEETSFTGRILSYQERIAINAWAARSTAVRGFEGYVRSVFETAIDDIHAREVAFSVVSLNIRRIVAEQARRIELEDELGAAKMGNFIQLVSHGVLPIGFKYDKVFLAWKLPAQSLAV